MRTTMNPLTALLVLALMLGALPLTTIATDSRTGSRSNTDAEPNNDFSTASDIVGTSVAVTGTKGSVADVYDYYKIQLNAGGGSADKLTVDGGCSPCGVGNLVRLAFFSPERLWYSHQMAFSVSTTHSITPEASGWYYIRIELQGAAYTYIMNFTVTSTPFTPDDGNNAATTSQAVTFDAQGLFSTTKTIDNVSDPADFYAVPMTFTPNVAEDVLSAKVDGPLSGYIVVEIYHQQPGLGGIQFTDPIFAFIDPNNPASKQASQRLNDYNASVSETSVVRVWMAKGSGSYSLNLRRAQGHKDNDNTLATAQAALSGPHSGNVNGDVGRGKITGIDGVDYYKLDGKVGMIVNVTVTATDYSSTLTTPIIRVSFHDSQDQELPAGDLGIADDYADPAAEISTIFPMNDTYAVVVESQGGAGKYTMQIGVNTPPAILPATEVLVIMRENVPMDLDLLTVFGDFDGDTLTFTHGTLTSVAITVNGAGVATFTPAMNYSNPTKSCVPFTADDGFGGTVTTSVCTKVQGINHAPYIKAGTANPYPTLVLLPNGANSDHLNLAETIGDPDSFDEHIYSMTGNSSIQVYFAKKGSTGFHSGVVTITSGTDLVTETLCFVATDNGLDPANLMSPCLNMTVTVSTGPIIVTAKRIGSLAMGEDTNLSINLTEYLKFRPPAPPNEKLIYAGSGTDNLTVTVDRQTGLAMVVPKADWCGGPETIAFTATAAVSLVANSSSADITVTCANDPPTIGSTEPADGAKVDEGGNITFAVTVSDKDTNLSKLTYIWRVNGVVQAGAVGATWTYVPSFTVAKSGTVAVVVTVTINDTALSGAVGTWNAVVKNVNRAPTNVRIIKPDTNSTWTTKQKVQFQAAPASDPDNDNLTYGWYDGSVSSATQIGEGPDFLKALKKGTHVIILSVSDNTTATEARITLKIVAAPKTGGFIPGFEAGLGVASLLVAALAAAGALRSRRRSA